MTILHACRADPTRDAPLVRALMDVADPDTGRTLSDEDIRRELVVFLGAGYDTTATTLTYALWALGRHPELQDRVAAEVAAVGDRPLTADDVPRLSYTVQVLNEALRLCPPAPVATRMLTKDFDVDGYRVEAGSWAIVGIYAMHRDPAFWDHPLVFDPNRFSRSNSKDRDRWQYLPFGGGPRRASATTSPCSKRPSVWQPSSGTPKYNRSTTTFPWQCPSPWSPAPRSEPAYGRGIELPTTAMRPSPGDLSVCDSMTRSAPICVTVPAVTMPGPRLLPMGMSATPRTGRCLGSSHWPAQSPLASWPAASGTRGHI